MGLNERAHHWALFFHKGTCWDGFPVGLNFEFAIPAIQEVSGAVELRGQKVDSMYHLFGLLSGAEGLVIPSGSPWTLWSSRVIYSLVLRAELYNESLVLC